MTEVYTKEQWLKKQTAPEYETYISQLIRYFLACFYFKRFPWYSVAAYKEAIEPRVPIGEI